MAKVFRPRLLRHARREAGYSRPQLSRLLRRRTPPVMASPATIKNYERGTYAPTTMFLDAVAQVLGLKDATRFYGEDAKVTKCEKCGARATAHYRACFGTPEVWVCDACAGGAK